MGSLGRNDNVNREELNYVEFFKSYEHLRSNLTKSIKSFFITSAVIAKGNTLNRFKRNLISLSIATIKTRQTSEYQS